MALGTVNFRIQFNKTPLWLKQYFKFQVLWPFGSGEETKNRFKVAAILDFDRINFSFFICKLPRFLLSSFKSIGLSVQEKKFNIDFQDTDHLGFPIRTILTTFDLQVTSIL